MLLMLAESQGDKKHTDSEGPRAHLKEVPPQAGYLLLLMSYLARYAYASPFISRNTHSLAFLPPQVCN